MTNWALSNTVTRLVVSVGVAYGSDLDLVKRLLLQAAHEQPSVLKDPEPRALFFNLWGKYIRSRITCLCRASI